MNIMAAHSRRSLLGQPAVQQRLTRFREEHPEVEIVARGYWQALIPEPDGETVITRWDLGEFLDKLDSLFSSQTECGH
ncbi:MAG TPA: hypothetical protein VIY52_29635 [Streptosporangiaceae bacterium]